METKYALDGQVFEVIPLGPFLTGQESLHYVCVDVCRYLDR